MTDKPWCCLLHSRGIGTHWLPLSAFIRLVFWASSSAAQVQHYGLRLRSARPLRSPLRDAHYVLHKRQHHGRPRYIHGAISGCERTVVAPFAAFGKLIIVSRNPAYGVCSMDRYFAPQLP
ncbi:hypothetical protein BU26DRAFT_11773 [Trematosphaeria pertusa]|uniref:Uncharacterized protein n=1 Tax=Trematosphaeria pertusa TaxID=390896 RepID=A0A6A6J382_9PLEO|nr:uncharacterized protein BU26DRAFT_11773 [Trematosphaeria pertusa]KAF2255923.1 hypothetical protein BU26DRAFT_11773 [Trematosphaeria pertusa]